MKRNQRRIFLICYLITLLTGSFAFAETKENNNFDITREVATLVKNAPDLNKKVLKLALTAYSSAKTQGIESKGILTIIDYSLPSDSKRLWVFNLSNNHLLFHTLVSHGKNSGDRYAYRFSNASHSLETSPGLYLTKSPYYGGHGYSLRLEGLDKGFNSNAEHRAIVVHGAWYVNQYYAKIWESIGRSWGCFAVPEGSVRPIINTIKDGSLIFAYAPDRLWQRQSVFLKTA